MSLFSNYDFEDRILVLIIPVYGHSITPYYHTVIGLIRFYRRNSHCLEIHSEECTDVLQEAVRSFVPKEL